MKYLIMIGDGMGDFPLDELGGKTPLEAAPTPNLDFMAMNGKLGVAQTVPEGMLPGSDVAIMSLMGYNPQGVLSGRGPLEAASQGVVTLEGEMVFRLNLVTVEHQGDNTIMRNHAAGNISTEEATELLDTLRESLPLLAGQRIFPGVSYRHILTWVDPGEFPSRPPHDYRDQDITHLLNDPSSQVLNDLIRASWSILDEHPVNKRRREQGLEPANSIWLWGQGYRPEVKTYHERWGITGATVSAVDLIKGLGQVTGLETINVPGATGWVDTDYEGKVKATLEALQRLDLVIIHLEAPDEASHQGDLESKLKAISDFDTKVVGPLLVGMPKLGSSFRAMACCDHYTPISLKTHTSDPIPFIVYSSEDSDETGSGLSYNEKNAAATGLVVTPGADLGLLLFGPEKPANG